MADCEMCGRLLVDGPTTSLHHLIPKLKGGRKGPTVLLHTVCHRFIHATFTEAELARDLNTMAALLEQEPIRKFVAWVSKKNPEFCDSSRETNAKKRKRR